MGQLDIRILDVRIDVKGGRWAFFTLWIDGIHIKGCIAHRHENGKVWFSPPAAVQLDSAGNVRRQPNGKPLALNVVKMDVGVNEIVQHRVEKLLQPYLKDVPPMVKAA